MFIRRKKQKVQFQTSKAMRNWKQFMCNEMELYKGCGDTSSPEILIRS